MTRSIFGETLEFSNATPLFFSVPTGISPTSSSAAGTCMIAASTKSCGSIGWFLWRATTSSRLLLEVRRQRALGILQRLMSDYRILMSEESLDNIIQVELCILDPPAGHTYGIIASGSEISGVQRRSSVFPAASTSVGHVMALAPVVDDDAADQMWQWARLGYPGELGPCLPGPAEHSPASLSTLMRSDWTRVFRSPSFVGLTFLLLEFGRWVAQGLREVGSSGRPKFLCANGARGPDWAKLGIVLALRSHATLVPICSVLPSLFSVYW